MLWILCNVNMCVEPPLIIYAINIQINYEFMCVYEYIYICVCMCLIANGNLMYVWTHFEPPSRSKFTRQQQQNKNLHSNEFERISYFFLVAFLLLMQNFHFHDVFMLNSIHVMWDVKHLENAIIEMIFIFFRRLLFFCIYTHNVCCHISIEIRRMI